MKNIENRNRLRSTVAVGIILSAITSSFCGCGSGTDAGKGSEFLIAEEPGGAIDVLTLRADATEQQDVVVIGRIGGRPDPWIKGTAAFPIVDRSLKACNEIEGDTCETPWDYCCEPNLADATVLVKVVDEAGKVVKEDPRELLNVKELQTVVVKGRAERDNDGNVTVIASQLHVRADQQAKK